MHQGARKRFNDSFSDAKYDGFVSAIAGTYPNMLDFRVAETPVFVPHDLKQKMLLASTEIIEVLRSPGFREKTDRAVPPNQWVPNENNHTSFLAIDFAVCRNDAGALVPQLIELQGFPSVFAYQALLSEHFRAHFDVDPDFDYLFGNMDYHGYVATLKELIVADEDPEQVILLEIYPETQKTRIDFAATEAMLGVKAVCYTKLVREGRKLFYEKDGRRIQVKRIYNRLIFDDLENCPNLTTNFQFTDDVDVHWVGHPNWFFRISKFSMPFLSSEFVPTTRFVSDYAGCFPADLDNYVLKPLFSFAGTGVNLHVKPEDLLHLKDPENYILQKKVIYEPVIQAPDGLVKCEIRLMYGWKDNDAEPELLISLSRLSRGEMIGVRYNKDFTWVGSSAAFFEKD